MKKISIILSTVVTAALLALASCSNVTELNGSEFDVYKANASGKSLAQAEAAAAAETAAAGKRLTFVIQKGSILKEDAKLVFATKNATPEISYTWTLANKATQAVAASAYTITIAGINYNNDAIAVGATTVTFTAASQPINFMYNSSSPDAGTSTDVAIVINP